MRALRAVALLFLAAPGVLLPWQGASAADLGDRRSGKIARIEQIPAEPVALPFTWGGLYFGAHIGYGWSDVDWQNGGSAASHDGSGWLAGGQIGVNLQTGRIVYGVEADLSSSWVEGSNDGCCGHGINWLSSVRGRIGLTSYDNRWLFYATGGGAWAAFDYASTDFSGHSETQFGWVARGGIERALTSSLTARVEYLYYDFDSITAPAGALGGTATTVDPSLHTVRFGLNYKF